MSKHEFVWDGRGERGDDARFSVVPGGAATDMDLSELHLRILLHMGRFSAKKGWCRLNQRQLAELLGVTREAVNRALRDLVSATYLEKRSQAETGESFCYYRTVLDPKGGVNHTSHGVYGTDHTGVTSHVTPVCAHSDHTNKIDHVDHVEDRSAKPVLDDVDKRRRPAVVPRFVSEAALDEVREIAPGWDRQMLLHKFMSWSGSRTAEKMDAAFLGWVRSFTKGKAAA